MSTDVNIKLRLGSSNVQVDDGSVRAFLASDPGLRNDILRRGNNVAAYQQRACPYHTGRLQGTIRTQPGTEGGLPSVEVIAGREGLTPYLGYVLYGTKPHRIAARRAKTLRFVSNGRVIFRKRVNHPGSRAQPFVQDSIEAARD